MWDPLLTRNLVNEAATVFSFWLKDGNSQSGELTDPDFEGTARFGLFDRTATLFPVLLLFRVL